MNRVVPSRLGRFYRRAALLHSSALVALTALLGSCAPAAGVLPQLAPAPPSAPAASTSAALAQLGSLRVIPGLPDLPGYDRSCSPGKACSFGQAWSDGTDAPGAHDGCDSRNQAIAMAATQVVRRGSCKVVSGVLDDPYTGADVSFTAQTVSRLNGDHLISLKRAWGLGAASWSPQRRATFANDISFEIVITTSAANNDKGDRGIGQWQPPNLAYRCEYAARYLAVTVAYQLPLTQQDHDTIATVLTSC